MDTNFIITLIVLVHLPKSNQIFGAVVVDCWIISSRQYYYHL